MNSQRKCCFFCPDTIPDTAAVAVPVAVSLVDPAAVLVVLVTINLEPFAAVLLPKCPASVPPDSPS